MYFCSVIVLATESTFSSQNIHNDSFKHIINFINFFTLRMTLILLTNTIILVDIDNVCGLCSVVGAGAFLFLLPCALPLGAAAAPKVVGPPPSSMMNPHPRCSPHSRCCPAITAALIFDVPPVFTHPHHPSLLLSMLLCCVLVATLPVAFAALPIIVASAKNKA
jgi:hypothetical protein